MCKRLYDEQAALFDLDQIQDLVLVPTMYILYFAYVSSVSYSIFITFAAVSQSYQISTLRSTFSL